MKYGFWIIAQFIVLLWVLLIVMNFDYSINIALISQMFAGILNTQPVYYNINAGILLAILFAAGEGSMFFFLLPTLKQKADKEGAYERKLEKTAVSNDESSAKVKVLEAKIEVLEKALKDALNRQ